jgi:hypothetical protein
MGRVDFLAQTLDLAMEDAIKAMIILGIPKK